MTLIERLQALASKHEQQGRVSHAAGVRSAIALIKRDGLRPPAPQSAPAARFLEDAAGQVGLPGEIALLA